MREHRSLAAWLRGPLPALPRPLDAASERWASLRPRVRILVAVAAIAVAIGIGEARIMAAESRWGGAGVDVLVATRDLPVGSAPEVTTVTHPPRAVPPGAATEIAEGARLSLALPEGAVLTDSHLDAAGPGAGLDDGLRAVPFPVERGWGVTAGGWVDVWVLGGNGEPAVQVSSSRPVLELARDDTGRKTALVGMATDEVGLATEGLALGRVLLTHAPAPGGDR